MKKTLIQWLLVVLVSLVASSYKLNAQNDVELWGALASGGLDNLGTLGHYNLTTSTWTTDHDFTTPFPGGNSKRSQLTEVDGKQYGIIGGGAHGAGLLFEWDPATNLYTKKFDFSPVNGSDPVGSLTYADGKLYGMTTAGGVYGVGVIFEWNLATNGYAKKIDFNSYDLGARPHGSLTYFDGKLYGMTLLGGAYSSGVIFEWDPAANVCTKKFDFSGTNGTLPYGSLTYGGGNFYGMTRTGGEKNVGVLFEWNPFTNVYTKKVDFDGANGSGPVGALTYDGEKFYGMTAEGGAYGWGVLFEWSPLTNTYSKKMDFNTGIGAQPQGSLIYIGGKFYGTTFFGGSALGSGGVLFEWDPSTNGYAKKFNFNDADGNSPFGSLNYSSGKLYGMTHGGGANNYGVIFQWEVNTNVYSKKIDFNTAANGANPYGGLAYVGGKFYGATRTGGTYGYGVLFEWNPQVKVYTKKLDFNKANGAYPEGSLTYRDGKFYGLTYRGGINNEGVLFEWDPVTNKYLKKVDFNNSIASSPNGTLTEFDGKFYGITIGGGAGGGGVIFEWDPSSNIYKNRLNFICVDGCHPQNSMTLVNGKFYGMTNVGGAYNLGVIFVWDPVTNLYTKKIDFNEAIGSMPFGCKLTYIGDKFYGTTPMGGTYQGGILFEWDPVTNLCTKKIDFYLAFGSGRPSGSLIYNYGNLYGTTDPGVGDNLGVLFEWNPTTNKYIKKISFNSETGVSPQQFLLIETNPEPVATPTIPATNISFGNVLSASMTVSFTPGNGTHRLAVMKAGSAPAFQPVDNILYSGDIGNEETVVYNGADSTFKLTSLLPDTEYYITIFEFNTDNTSTRYLVTNTPLAIERTEAGPQLVGLAANGGAYNGGTMFGINQDGTGLTTLYNFTFGSFPLSSLIQGSDGVLYGVTKRAPSAPTNPKIFKINIDGSGYEVLYNFNGNTGNPSGSLIQTTDGSFFGMTTIGNWGTYGTIFKIKPDGEGYTELQRFSIQTGYHQPGFLMQASNGSLYGMTYGSGSAGIGMIFKMNADGDGYTVLHNFSGPDGTYPYGALIEGADGSLYGVTNQGGLHGVGTIYKINKDGSGFYVVHSFNRSRGGFYPSGSLTQAPDGSLYGMTIVGGAYDYGSIYKIKTNGSGYTVLQYFNGMNGKGPVGNMVYQNNALFGYTTTGGQSDSGVIFKYDLVTSTYSKLADLNDSTGVNPQFGNLLILNPKPISKSYVISPIYNASNVPTNLKVTANQVPGAETYTIELNTNPAFSDSTAIVKTGDRVLTFSNLALSTVYYTRVKTNLTLYWGDTRYFTTGDALALSYITSPGNNSTNASWEPAVKVNAITEANNYTIQLCASKDFVSSSVLEMSGDSTVINFTGLQRDTKYYSRVTTNITPESWGPVHSFTTGNPVSLAFVKNPSNYDIEKNTSLNITANVVPGVSQYTIQLSEFADFSLINFEVTDSSYILLFSGLKYNTTYYNRVLTNLATDYGEVHWFNTRTAESRAFVTSPGDNTMNISTNPKITSNNVPYSGEYIIQLSEHPDFSVIAFEKMGASRTLKFSGLAPGTTYYNRVRTDLSLVYGPVRSFTTKGSSPLARIAGIEQTEIQSDELKEYEVHVYPNPFTDKLVVYVASKVSEEVEIKLLDMNGRIVHQSMEKANATIELSKPLANGVYILWVYSGSIGKWIRVVKVE